jgi:hypothetical protein
VGNETARAGKRSSDFDTHRVKRDRKSTRKYLKKKTIPPRNSCANNFKELYQNPSSRFQQMSRQPMVRNAVWMSARLS